MVLTSNLVHILILSTSTFKNKIIHNVQNINLGKSQNISQLLDKKRKQKENTNPLHV